jgi:hypothetical protein
MNFKLCVECQYEGSPKSLSQDTPFAMEQEGMFTNNNTESYFKSWLCLRCLHYDSNYPEEARVEKSNQKIVIKCIHCPYYLFKQQNSSLKEKIFTCPCCNWNIKIDTETNTFVADPKTFIDERIAWFLDTFKKQAEDNYRDDVISTILFEENSSSEFRDLDDWVESNYFTPDSNS